jgi:hypothetical protein
LIVIALVRLSDAAYVSIDNHYNGKLVIFKQGLKLYYSLTNDDVIGLLDALRQAAERHVADYLPDAMNVPLAE